MVEVIATDEFAEWYEALDSKDSNAVSRLVDLLAEYGVSLRRPYSGTIKTSRHGARELIAQAGGRPLRVFYCFDPEREAILLCGGDKTGDDRFYEVMVPLADRLFETYLREKKKKK